MTAEIVLNFFIKYRFEALILALLISIWLLGFIRFSVYESKFSFFAGLGLLTFPITPEGFVPATPGHLSLIGYLGSLLIAQSSYVIWPSGYGHESLLTHRFQINAYTKCVSYYLSLANLIVDRSLATKHDWKISTEVFNGFSMYLAVAGTAHLIAYMKSRCENAFVDRLSWINRTIRIDSFVSLLIGVTTLAWSNKLVLNELFRNSHALLLKLAACIQIGLSLQSLHSVSLAFQRVKAQMLLSRIFSSACILMAILQAHFRFDSIPTSVSSVLLTAFTCYLIYDVFVLVVVARSLNALRSKALETVKQTSDD